MKVNTSLLKNIVTYTSSTTLSKTDAGKLVIINDASSNNLTVPANADVPLKKGTVIDVMQQGFGQTTIVAGSGVTIYSIDGNLALGSPGEQIITARLTKIDTNLWLFENNLNFTDLSGLVSKSAIPVVIQLACSDESTVLSTGTGKITFRMPHAMTLTAVRASLTVAGTTSGLTTIDINEGGNSILSTKLTIDLTEKTSTTSATPAVISDASLADDAEITIDIDAISGGATEKGLKVTLIGTRTV